MNEQEMLEEIYDLVEQVQELYEELRQRLMRLIAHTPQILAWIANQIREGWEALCELAGQMWIVLRRILQFPGWPWATWSTADRWTIEVGGPVSAVIGIAEAGSLDADSEWSGDAAERYREILPQQRAALAAIKSQFADKIALMLQTLTGGIIVFWVLLIAAIVKLVVCLVAAVGETATVIGAPAAPPTAGPGVGAFLATLGVGTAALLTTALVARANLSNAANDYSCFAGGHWPEAKLA